MTRVVEPAGGTTTGQGGCMSGGYPQQRRGLEGLRSPAPRWWGST